MYDIRGPCGRSHSSIAREHLGYMPPMSRDTSDEAREGLVDNIAGKAKEVVGAVSGNDNLVEEGQLQQAEARSRKDAVARDAIADAERAEAGEELRESSREARSQHHAANDAAERDKAQVGQQRADAYAAADRDAELRELHGAADAQAHADQVAEAGVQEAATIAEEAEATERHAQAEKSRLEREAANAEDQAARLRDQAQN